METEERTLASLAAELFLVDPTDPEEARRGLLALRGLALKSPFDPPHGEFIETIGDIAQGRDGTPRQFDLQNILKALKQLAEQIPATSGHNAYHNLAHALLTAASRVVLERIERRDRATARDSKGWTSEDFYRLLRGVVVAFNHDNGHDGTSNIQNGAYVPGRLEEKAYALLDPILSGCGIGPSEKRFIRHATLMTDPLLPGEILKYGAAFQENRIIELAGRMSGAGSAVPVEIRKYVDAHRAYGPILALSRKDLLDCIGEAPPETRLDLRTIMSRVEKDPELVRESLLTKASDLGVSYGLGEDVCNEDNRTIHQEAKTSAADAPVLVDENGKTLPDKQLAAILNCIGARRKADGTVTASFMHPTADQLFGDKLRELAGTARNNLAPEKAAAVEAAAVTHQPFLDLVKRRAA